MPEITKMDRIRMIYVTFPGLSPRITLSARAISNTLGRAENAFKFVLILSEPILRAKDQSPTLTEFELYMVLILSRHILYSIYFPFHPIGGTAQLLLYQRKPASDRDGIASIVV